MDSIITKLHTSTYTKVRVLHRLGILQHVLEQVLYRAEAEVSVADRFATELTAYAEPSDVEALTALGTEWLQTINESNLPSELARAREQIEAMPTMTIYVPEVFDEAAEAVLGTWCRDEVDAKLLLELEVDPQVIGGCAVLAHDTLHEYSLRTRLAADATVIPKLVAQYD